MAGNLRARLARMRGRAEPAPRRESLSPEAFPDGWTTIGEGLRFRETSGSLPGTPSQGPLRLGLFSRRLDQVECAAGGLVFFDLETTGLSGGSGTVAFLAAFGRPGNDGSMLVRQYFMDDYPAEPAFIERLSAEFSDAEAVVSYNGSSFDMPLYAVRRAMNDFGPAEPKPHVDVLHASRRLWRSTIGNCSLSSIEDSVLGISRSDDIPGFEVPEAWFDWVKRGRSGLLARVFEHNELDVRSLAALFFLIVDAARGSGWPPGCDAVGLASIQSRIDEALAERTLRQALAASGREAVDHRAARPLMRLLGRSGRLAEREDLVRYLPDDAAGLFSKSVHAERREKNVTEALRLALLSAGAAREGGTLAMRALKRAARLEGKLAGLESDRRASVLDSATGL